MVQASRGVLRLWMFLLSLFFIALLFFVCTSWVSWTRSTVICGNKRGVVVVVVVVVGFVAADVRFMLLALFAFLWVMAEEKRALTRLLTLNVE